MEIAVLKRKKINIQRLLQMGDCLQHRSLTVLMTCVTYCWGTICDKSSLREEEFVSAQFEGRAHQNQGRHGCRNVRLLVPQLGTKERDES